MSARRPVEDIAPAADRDRNPDPASARREGFFILLGFLAVGLIVTFVRQEPLAATGPWAGTTTAAGEAAPALGAELVRLLDALRANVVAWRLVSLVIIGSIAGMAANRLIPGNRAGTPAAMLFGILGAALGGWVCEHFGYALPSCITVANVGVAFVGAVVTLISAKLLAMV